MAMKIIRQRCIQCGNCLPVCPNDGISEDRGEYTANPRLCTQCYGFAASPVCAEVCPTDAVVVDMEHMEPIETLALRASLLRPDHFPID